MDCGGSTARRSVDKQSMVDWASVSNDGCQRGKVTPILGSGLLMFLSTATSGSC
jgi:hypothetical protein